MPRYHEVAVETVHNPGLYPRHQLQLALKVAFLLGRGRFVLAEDPQER